MFRIENTLLTRNFQFMNRKNDRSESLAFFRRLKKLQSGAKIFLLLLLMHAGSLFAQTELIINTTGYGFNKSEANGINAEQWEYIKKFINLSHNGQDASVTAVRLHIEWHQYEPTPGNYLYKPG